MSKNLSELSGRKGLEQNLFEEIGIPASFPVEASDDLMLISDQGQTIRVAVEGVSTQGRAAGGVTIFKVDEGEKVVSVERIADVAEGEA